jgi:hypothetical protein
MVKITDLKELIALLVDVEANYKATNPTGKAAFISAIKAFVAKLNILVAQEDTTVPLDETGRMLAAVASHIKHVDNKKVLDGRTFAGDIPPQVMWAFYNKLMQTTEVVVSPVTEDEKKRLSLPAVALVADNTPAERIEAIIENGSEEDAKFIRAMTYIQSAVSAISVEKATRAISNDTLITIARAEGLLDESEINLLTPTGWGLIPRKEIAYRVYNFYNAAKEKNDDGK